MVKRKKCKRITMKDVRKVFPNARSKDVRSHLSPKRRKHFLWDFGGIHPVTNEEKKLDKLVRCK